MNIYIYVYIYIKHKLKEGPLSLSLHGLCVSEPQCTFIHMYSNRDIHLSSVAMPQCGIVSMWQCFNASLCESHIELE